MSHAHAGMSPTEAKRLARIIDRANSRNPVPFQFVVRTRAKVDAPYGQWTTHRETTCSSRKQAERQAAKLADDATDTSILEWGTDGY